MMMNENIENDALELNEEQLDEVAGGKSSTEKVKATGNANVRTGPGLSYGVIGSISKGDTLTYLGIAKKDDRGVRWYKVKFSGQNGWISSKYSKVL